MTEWTDFMEGKMGPYMKKYDGHKNAMQVLSKEYKKEKLRKLKNEKLKKARKLKRRRNRVCMK